jgi:hypothetical protein
MRTIAGMSDSEVIELGRLLCSDPTWNGFEISGRPVTNCEMYAMSQFAVEERQKAERFLKEEL